MAQSPKTFFTPTTPSPEKDEFAKQLMRASNTGLILTSALKFNVFHLGIGMKDSSFPSSDWCSQYQHVYWLFVEGKWMNHYELSWEIMFHSKIGNRAGFPGASSLIAPNDFLLGIYSYDGKEWHKSTPA